MGSAVMISAATSHPDEAAALLDFLFAEESARIWIEEGNVIPPIDVDPSGFELPGLFQFVIDTVRANSTAGGLGLGYNIDVLTPPEFNTAMKRRFPGRARRHSFSSRAGRSSTGCQRGGQVARARRPTMK